MPRKFNQKLKDAIQKESRTQADFAFDVGTAEAIVSRVINGSQDITDALKKEWAKELKVEVSDIF